MDKAIEDIMAAAKARREAAGLKSTYIGPDGKPFDYYHPHLRSKAFKDFQYEVRAKYPTEDLVPADVMAKLKALKKASMK